MSYFILQNHCNVDPCAYKNQQHDHCEHVFIPITLHDIGCVGTDAMDTNTNCYNCENRRETECYCPDSKGMNYHIHCQEQNCDRTDFHKHCNIPGCKALPDNSAYHIHCSDKECHWIGYTPNSIGHCHYPDCITTTYHRHCDISGCDKLLNYYLLGDVYVLYQENHIHCKVSDCNETINHNHCDVNGCKMTYTYANSHKHCDQTGCNHIFNGLTETHKHCDQTGCNHIFNGLTEIHNHCEHPNCHVIWNSNREYHGHCEHPGCNQIIDRVTYHKHCRKGGCNVASKHVHCGKCHEAKFTGSKVKHVCIKKIQGF